MKSTKLFLCFNVLLFYITVAYACDPAEEGRPYLLKHSIAKVPWGVTMVTWTKDDILVADCPVVTASCTTNAMTWLVAGVIKTDDNITFFLNISSVSRLSRNNSKGIWKLETHTTSPRAEEFYNCNLQVYAKPTETKCIKNLSKDGLTVSCYGKQVYPEAMMSVIRAPYDSKTLSCKNTRSATELLYYDTECVRTFPMQDLHLKREDFIFCIYPNIIGFQNYDQISTNVSMSILTEPSYVSVQECNRTASSIHCSCDRLDIDDSKSGFIWYSDGAEVKRKSQLYTTTIVRDAVKDIWCKPVTFENPNDNVENKKHTLILVILFATLFVLASLIIMVLCIKNRMCHPIRELPQPILTKITVERTKVNDYESTNGDEAQMPLKSDNEANEFVTDNSSHDYRTDVTISNDIQFDPNIYFVKSSILLIGTRNSNKELFKIALLRKPFNVANIPSKSSEELAKKPDIQENIEKQKGRDNREDNMKKQKSNIHLHYSNRDDIVFKLVDGPEYDDKEVEKFKEEMKSCIVLCRERYNAVVVVYTKDKKTDATSLIYTLRDNFDFNMNNIIIIKSKYTHYNTNKPLSNSNHDGTQMKENSVCNGARNKFTKTENKNAVSDFKTLFGNRYIGLDLSVKDNDINEIFILVNKMEKANATPVFIKYDRTLTSNTNLETVLREFSLLIEIILNKTNKYSLETEQRLKQLQDQWQKCLAHNEDNLLYSVANVLREEDEDLVEDTEATSEQQSKESDEDVRKRLGVCQNVEYLIDCLKIIYFAPKRIERNEEILLSYFEECFNNFHDWYVEIITRIKDTVLDSNYKVGVYNKRHKRRNKTI